MKQYFMGIDIGTYESKGVLIGSDCKIITYCSERHELLNPKPGYFEHDAEKTWWGDFCTLSNRLIRESGVDAGQVGCVGLSALGCDCLPVDEDCTPLLNAILYGIDCRSSAEIDYLNKMYASRAIELFGHEICSSDIAPKILWLKNNFPEIHEKAAKFLTGSSFLCAKLTGNYTIDKYLAEDFAPLYDFSKDAVDREMCAAYCRPDQLAEIRHATDIAGYVTEKASRETGLQPGTKVLVGTGDSGAEAVSTGVFRQGDVMIQMGSSCYFICLCDHPVSEPRMWPGTFIIPGIYALCAGTNTAGTLTRWFRDEIFGDFAEKESTCGINAYEKMVDAVEQIPAGSNGLVCLPYFAGERTPINDPLAKGVFFGLTLSHTRAHLYKAALEGIGYTIARHFDIYKEDSIPVNKIMAVGGGTKNKIWLQVIADILGRPVCTAKVTFGASYGDAIMAALSGGAYKNWDELAKVIEPDLVIQPDMHAHEIYTRQRHVFDELYERNMDLMHELH